jgi:hypothetical protein
VLLVPLSSHPDFKPLVAGLTKVLRDRGLLIKVDDSSASIGKSIIDLGDKIYLITAKASATPETMSSAVYLV